MNKKGEDGITLIALVITIIVLLILAGVSIALVLGDNGILSQATKSSVETSHSSVKESLIIKNSEYVTLKSTGNIEEDFLGYLNNAKNSGIINENGEIDVEKLTGNKTGTGNGSNKSDVYLLTKLNSKYYLRYYDKNGNYKELLEIETERVEVKEEEWEGIFEVAEKHPEQTESNTIGIDMYGNVVDMDNWYIYEWEDMYSLGFLASGFAEPGYIGEIIDGKIIGEIPQYIKEETSNEYKKVNALIGTFQKNTELIYAPKIPNTIKDMSYTFTGCTNLKEACEIPYGVEWVWGCYVNCKSLVTLPDFPDSITGMGSVFQMCDSLEVAPKLSNNATDISMIFYKCPKLKVAPEIPNSVENMSSAFDECTSLTTAPQIPSNVKDISMAFYGCTNLTGTLEINTNPTSYSGCLYKTATAEGTDLKLTGTSTMLNEILETANGNVSLLEE